MLEPLIGNLSYHATSQFKLLKHNLINVVEDETEKLGNSSVVRHEKLFHRLKQCVLQHQEIL